MWNVQKNTIFQDKMQPANCWGSPLYQATKQHLNNSSTVKYNENEDGEVNHLPVFGWAMLFLLGRMFDYY